MNSGAQTVSAMDCLNHPDVSTCGLNIYVAIDARETRRQMAICGVDCHHVSFVPGNEETTILFTGCSRVQCTLERVFGKGEISPGEVQLPLAGEYRFSGVFSRRMRGRTPEQILAALTRAGEPFTLVDETGQPIS